MHWCAYPSPTHSLMQHNELNSSAIFNHVWENSRRDWKNIKMATRKTSSKKVLSLFFLQNASVSQTQKHRFTSMGAKFAIR